jgi:hypothetical protein
MHDTRLENELRTALRAEGDALPLTITDAELGRRLALRRRERAGRRFALAAAAVVVVAVGSMVAFGGGWLQLPGVGVDASPSPETSAPTPSDVAPTAEPSPTNVPAVTADPDRPPLGRSDEAVIARIGPEADGRVTLEVDLLRDIQSVPTVFAAGFPAGRVASDDPPRVGPDGYLAVPLADAANADQARGVAVYDLLDSTRAPEIFETDDVRGANGVAWSPDGRLAIFEATFLTVVRPFGPDGSTTVAIPGDIQVVSYGPAQDEVWAADGRGIAAWRNFNEPPSGILRLDGIFEPELPPQVSSPTGNERTFDASGRAFAVWCESVDPNGVGSGCRLQVEVPGTTGETWYIVPAGEVIADYRWDARLEGAWILVERAAAGGSNGTVELRHGDATGFETITSVADRGDPRILGISSDDARLAIDLGDGQVMSVPSDPAVEGWGGIGGVFAGWADQDDGR